MTKADRARNLRYKRPALLSLGYEMIESELYDICGACDEVRYYMDSNDDTILNALDGDEEAEYEFKMAFADDKTTGAGRKGGMRNEPRTPLSENIAKVFYRARARR